MISRIEIEKELTRLEVWIGRKLSGEFKPYWVDECSAWDYSGFLKAVQSFRNNEYFPSLRDFKAAYGRGANVTEHEQHPGCDWCDHGIIAYTKDGYEYEGRCSVCNIQIRKYSKMPLINPTRPHVELHPSHGASKKFCEQMREEGKDPHASRFTSVSEVNPFKGKPDPRQERVRQKSLSMDRRREEFPF